MNPLTHFLKVVFGIIGIVYLFVAGFNNLPHSWILQFGSWNAFLQSVWRLLKVIALVGAAFTLLRIWIYAHESDEQVKFLNGKLHEAGKLRSEELLR